MGNMLVSIIIPTFNSEKFIAETIQSIQAQTYTKWEVIIVDDGSSDKTVSIISKLAQFEERIQFFQLEGNSGAGIARNIALNKVNGRYIAFLDSDDLISNNKISEQINIFRLNPESDFILATCSFAFFDKTTNSSTIYDKEPFCLNFDNAFTFFFHL